MEQGGFIDPCGTVFKPYFIEARNGNGNPIVDHEQPTWDYCRWCQKFATHDHLMNSGEHLRRLQRNRQLQGLVVEDGEMVRLDMSEEAVANRTASINAIRRFRSA